ncbi:neprilysin-2-like [Stegodyphus dumicola]|uniref:neprilysin-2-like n=1 Tax=Stegodyphus dumicola TaxID=202533 RepID=UPI0015A8DD4A|nr:neprilysin-2-like [Stegodyphus dumicola]
MVSFKLSGYHCAVLARLTFPPAASIDEVGSTPLEDVLQNLGGWPVVEGEKWREDSFDWLDTVIEFRKRGYDFDVLMSFDVTQDYKNNTAHIIELDQPRLALSRNDFLSGLNSSVTEAYFKLMVKAANKLGANKDTSKAELREVLHFIALLANLTTPEEQRRDLDAMYHKYTVNQLAQEVPKINWMKYFNGVLRAEVFENDTLINMNPSFIQGVADLINTTDKRVVANFLMWTLVDKSMHQLSKDWRGLKQEFRAVAIGEIQEKPRWEQCLSPVSRYLGEALSFYYVQNYFKEDSKDAALEMVRYIRTAFLNMLENLEWIEEGTKQRAKEKAEAMHLHIGFPKELLNDSYVSDLYKDLKFNTSESYFGMRRKLDIWETDESFSLLRKPSIKGLWKNYAMVVIVNAYYSFLENSMTFPAGVLQEPLYGNDRPKYLNFGSIGSIIGHEITHGFDDMGRQFDENGNNVRWGDDVTDQHFKTKVQCIIEQYGNYTTENGLQLNGINTQGENLADNGGMKAAFLAYKLWAKDHGSEPRLPGLNYTPNQLFWISLANVWCNKVRPEALRAEITQESHTPMRFRVPGALSNLPEFAEEFNCSSESAMVRKNRCHIW